MASGISLSEFLLRADVIDLLREEIAAVGSQSEWSKKKRIERTTLNAALRGRRSFQPKLLKALGLEKVVVYRRVAGKVSN